MIVDYKTGKPKTQEDADDSLQLSIYALAARDKGLTAVVVGLHQSGKLHRGGSRRARRTS